MRSDLAPVLTPEMLTLKQRRIVDRAACARELPEEGFLDRRGFELVFKTALNHTLNVRAFAESFNRGARFLPGLNAGVSSAKNRMTAASKTKTKVLKDFSDLRPVEDRIALVANEICVVAFKGESISSFEPEPKTQIHRVWSMGKLDERHQIAWQTFMDDVRLAKGKSGKVTSSYGDFVNRSDEGDFRIPTAFACNYFRRVERLFISLGRRQRWLLLNLLQDTLKAKCSITLETIGIVRSGYKDKDNSRTAGVVHIQTLLDSVADFYGI